jgi:hypothetical protein
MPPRFSELGSVSEKTLLYITDFRQLSRDKIHPLEPYSFRRRRYY